MGLEPARRNLEPTGRGLELAERASDPAGRAFEPSGWVSEPLSQGRAFKLPGWVSEPAGSLRVIWESLGPSGRDRESAVRVSEPDGGDRQTERETERSIPGV